MQSSTTDSANAAEANGNRKAVTKGNPGNVTSEPAQPDAQIPGTATVSDARKEELRRYIDQVPHEQVVAINEAFARGEGYVAWQILEDYSDYESGNYILITKGADGQFTSWNEDVPILDDMPSLSRGADHSPVRYNPVSLQDLGASAVNYYHQSSLLPAKPYGNDPIENGLVFLNNTANIPLNLVTTGLSGLGDGIVALERFAYENEYVRVAAVPLLEGPPGRAWKMATLPLRAMASSSRMATTGAINLNKLNLPPLRGTGPAPGVFELSARTTSSSAVENYSPLFRQQTRGGIVEQRGVEFIFDTEKNVFLVGKQKGYSGNVLLSPHQRLAELSRSDNSNVVGGMFSRSPSGAIRTDEYSGHFHDNWNEATRQKFISFMRDNGLEVEHKAWSGL